MLSLTELKKIFLKHGFKPLKRLGENYLVDANIKDKIIEEAHVAPDDTVLEIGSGFGALTVDLASTGAKIFAVEKDKLAYSIFKEIVADNFPNLKLFNEDILDFDIRKAAGEKKVKVVGNLPYYVTTPVIEYLLDNKGSIESALVLVQKEVADRLLAQATCENYGSISCFVQYHTKLSHIRTISADAFFPEPEVDSSLVRLDILEKPSVHVADEKLLFCIIRGAFNQRRKTILNSLSRQLVLDLPKDELAKVLAKISVDPFSRPEDLSLQSFANIANALM